MSDAMSEIAYADGRMAAIAPLLPGRGSQRRATDESGAARWALIAIAAAFLGLFVLLPLGAVFTEAFRAGTAAFWEAISEPDAVAALKLTLLAAGIAVPANLVFGVAASWAIAKHEFRGKSLLNTLIDLPFSISPVISGLIYILLFGAQSALGPCCANTASKSSSRSRASCSRPSSSPFPSSPVSSFRSCRSRAPTRRKPP
ncbi:Sulfate transport system permease protein CysW [Methyloligella halotolerans]|uniref:Sulfate transport system permease protein CysW n=1 Tax=Methyloligella halotolerans TaxID=1177755 RepID=A0A1E2RV74_9HYPH|nr:Sulfate transport system permease protein CysW [Methyloligella halotolerans]